MKWLLPTMVVIAIASITPAANGQSCVGLDCPGVMPASSQAHAMLHSVAKPRDLESEAISGFYEFGLNEPTLGTRAVAYVATPGTLDSAPAAIQALPAAKVLSASERTNDTNVIYGPGIVVSEPTPAAAAARKVRKPVAHAADATCYTGWFCLYDGSGYSGAKGQWSDEGYWQNLAAYGWANRASSMINNRDGATLLAPGTNGAGSRYCAQPNSSDSNFNNNDGIDNNAESLYNSSAPDYHSGWNCFNPY